MPDATNDLPDDQTGDTDLEGGLDGEGGQQGVDTEALQARIAELESLNSKQSRDLIAAIGRLQALDEKLSKGSEDTAAVATLRAQMSATNEMLDALLEDEALDPKVRERAGRVRTKAQTDADRAEREALRREIEALKNPPRTAPEPVAAGPTPFEEGIVTAIEAAGLDPDDAIFDWKGEASRIMTAQGQRAVVAYFKTKIAEGLAAKNTDTRREGRRTAGLSQTGTPVGGADNPLDMSRSAEERYKHLKAIGAV